MIVSLIALFVAMGGTTYAVTKLPKRSVGSLQLKKGAVHKEHIATGAVTVSKLGKGLVTSAPAGPAGPTTPVIVNEELPSDGVSYAVKAGWADKAGKADRATLADKATTATSATSATSAGSASTAGSAANADTLDGKDSTFFLPRATIVDLPRFVLANGETRQIFVNGPLKYTARCSIGAGGIDRGEILISTTENHSAFDGDDITPNLLTTSPESRRMYVYVEGPTGQPAFKAEDDGTAIAPSAEVRSTVWWVGINLFNTTGGCHFGGYAMI